MANILSCDINFDFGLDGDSYAIGGKGFRTDIDPGIASISGTIKAFFQNKDLLNKAVNGTESSSANYDSNKMTGRLHSSCLNLYMNDNLRASTVLVASILNCHSRRTIVQILVVLHPSLH